MPIEIRVDPEQRLIRADIVGDFTLDEIFDGLDASVGHPDFEPGFNVLTDHSAVGTPITTFQAEQLAARLDALRESMKGARWAAVVTTPVSHGMMRMIGALTEHVPVAVRVFNSMAEAEAWLAEPEED